MTPKITETELHNLSDEIILWIPSIDIQNGKIESSVWSSSTEAPPIFIDLIDLLWLFKVEISALQLERLKHRCIYTIDFEEFDSTKTSLQYVAHVFEIIKNLVLEQEIMTVNELERILYQLQD